MVEGKVGVVVGPVRVEDLEPSECGDRDGTDTKVVRRRQERDLRGWGRRARRAGSRRRGRLRRLLGSRGRQSRGRRGFRRRGRRRARGRFGCVRIRTRRSDRGRRAGLRVVGHSNRDRCRGCGTVIDVLAFVQPLSLFINVVRDSIYKRERVEKSD